MSSYSTFVYVCPGSGRVEPRWRYCKPHHYEWVATSTPHLVVSSREPHPCGACGGDAWHLRLAGPAAAIATLGGLDAVEALVGGRGSLTNLSLLYLLGLIPSQFRDVDGSADGWELCGGVVQGILSTTGVAEGGRRARDASLPRL